MNPQIRGSCIFKIKGEILLLKTKSAIFSSAAAVVVLCAPNPNCARKQEGTIPVLETAFSSARM
jgi:hypothetical protein